VATERKHGLLAPLKCRYAADALGQGSHVWGYVLGRRRVAQRAEHGCLRHRELPVRVDLALGEGLTGHTDSPQATGRMT
jgi:hypothetical protein